ncbi:PLP-dependent aminotransferase family protein [Phyllobacterium sp. 0TCS1.6C]|uniref:aminotransferase-like domain-containing protein n=1 Tax=unclassified Phyllobacterium TaxID=2638441 RepID=UPI002264D54D|nr:MULTISPECIES: PLP-dependent aminotransferase family protein [unclassified Phyllobacterium]MCX8279363.1 PLP-dependent aminotransferase family protein [Phyllobacterium sp. 0TCS1.6C]MCX8292446.1 PLP-dependent aminotransferase family protein [Phyllobacterium sp. 0TCS1.6A]
MTNWLPNLDNDPDQGRKGPLYLRLAERIEADIAGGILPPGTKLPPQRNLAFDIGVTIGTVGRAYNLIRERGLVSGEVGRGTYVMDPKAAGLVAPASPSEPFGGTRSTFVHSGLIRLDSTAAVEVGQAELMGSTLTEITRQHPNEIASYSRSLPASWRDAGVRWLSGAGWSPDGESVVPTLGAHSAILAAIAAVTVPGDKIAFEDLTYCSAARSVNLMGRRSIIMHTQNGSATPEDFERLCAQQHPKLVFLMPSLHNPTAFTMPEDYRRAIAEIARRYNVWIIEDEIYGSLVEDDHVKIAAFAPERTFVIGGMSKSVAAGLRGGWVACPPHLAARVHTAHKMVTGGLPFLMAELTARLVNSGDADEIRARVRNEVRSRGAIARQALAGIEFSTQPLSAFLWVKLPDPWLSATFKNAALNEGVLIDDEDEFKTGRTEKTFHRVRLGITVPGSGEELKNGLTVLRRLMVTDNASYDSYS